MASVLIMDDDPDVCRTIESILETRGHEVRSASNGRDGLEKLREFDASLAIVDILMPVMEGVETIQRLVAEHPNLRIIAISGGGRMAPSDLLKLAKHMGVHAVLSKPFRSAELLQTVDSALDGRFEAAG